MSHGDASKERRVAMAVVDGQVDPFDLDALAVSDRFWLSGFTSATASSVIAAPAARRPAPRSRARRTSAPAGAARPPAVIRPGSSCPVLPLAGGARMEHGGQVAAIPQITASASGRAGSSPALIRTRRAPHPKRSLRM
jgi:hypothetical protein